MLSVTLHTHMYPQQYSFRETDDNMPDEDEMLVIGYKDLDHSIINADRLYDMSLYNMAYTTDTGFVNVNKLIRNL